MIAPIKDWQAEYGPGVIARHCASLDDYVVLTSPSAWNAVRKEFAHEPRFVEFVTSQEECYNQSMLMRLPQAAYVLGIGGGKALDASKLAAWKKHAKLILVPTVVSSGSVFTTGFPLRREGKLFIIPQRPRRP